MRKKIGLVMTSRNYIKETDVIECKRRSTSTLNITTEFEYSWQKKR